ncbi:CHAD domain-containing protein [Halioxenophilus sp. WMMB6]|uniref:CHAD domain-containing protein n=1 Tax=Halioxenophilus sp. WMMB6 TaxID=3073815 RepID=UPI00295EB6BF|nr:CHAD domain-containing protein [Halioxenophilus sp. WMMB6]
MKLVFQVNEPVALSVRRIHRQLLRKTVALLQSPTPPADAVHSARKNIKRLRALLRLVRTGLGESAFHQANSLLRDVNRSLCDLRDEQALWETHARLVKHRKKSCQESCLQAMAALLQQKSGQQQSLTGCPQAIPAAAAQQLSLCLLTPLPLNFTRQNDAVLGICESYQLSRNLYRQCKHSHDVKLMHAWRKRVKDFVYQAQYLAALYPAVLPPWLDCQTQLADLLGEYQDLSTLTDWLAQNRSLSKKGEKSLYRAMITLIEKEQATLKKSALKLGDKLFRKKPAEIYQSLAEQ